LSANFGVLDVFTSTFFSSAGAAASPFGFAALMTSGAEFYVVGSSFAFS